MKRSDDNGTRRHMILSLKLWGSSRWLVRSVRMANPTPPTRFSPLGLPLQKKVYPAPDSVNWSSSLKRVSESAAMSIRYRANSFATMAVRRSGLFEFSRRVLTFHVPTFILNLLFVFFLFVLPLQLRTAVSRRLLTSLMVEQAFV